MVATTNEERRKSRKIMRRGIVMRFKTGRRYTSDQATPAAAFKSQHRMSLTAHDNQSGQNHTS